MRRGRPPPDVEGASLAAAPLYWEKASLGLLCSMGPDTLLLVGRLLFFRAGRCRRCITTSRPTTQTQTKRRVSLSPSLPRSLFPFLKSSVMVVLWGASSSQEMMTPSLFWRLLVTPHRHGAHYLLSPVHLPLGMQTNEELPFGDAQPFCKRAQKGEQWMMMKAKMRATTLC